MHRPQGGHECRLAIACKHSAGLTVLPFQAELAMRAVEVDGQGGEILEGFDSLFGGLGILDGQLEIWLADSEISPEAEVC